MCWVFLVLLGVIGILDVLVTLAILVTWGVLGDIFLGHRRQRGDPTQVNNIMRCIVRCEYT